jgi:mono/diheme cytochrome c family protein
MLTTLEPARARSALILLMACAMVVASQPCSAQDKPAPQKAGYTVVDGYKVDANTMNGFRAWRAAACDRCHGANQQGMVGPSLLDSMKTLSKEEFVKVVRDGRLDKGMMSFASSQMVMENMDGLYAYLKGRANGDITRAKVEEIKP